MTLGLWGGGGRFIYFLVNFGDDINFIFMCHLIMVIGVITYNLSSFSTIFHQNFFFQIHQNKFTKFLKHLSNPNKIFFIVVGILVCDKNKYIHINLIEILI